jgi:hypothetical protein
MEAKQKRLFVSHASKDKDLADELVSLLIEGCAVSPNDILCSSLPGKGVPGGTPSFIDYLRAQLQRPDLVIFLLSDNFYVSQFCLCELGATWRMQLPYFPLVVPPLGTCDLSATLEVAQAGIITDQRYLDHMRDQVEQKLRTKVATETWNIKRDVFLTKLGNVLKSLPSPDLVSGDKHKEAQEQYRKALDEISNKEKKIKAQNAQISDLERCKNRDEVNAVARKHSAVDEVFEQLCSKAETALDNLQRATQVALYWDVRDEPYVPDGREEWDVVREAETVEEVWVDENYCYPSKDHPRVAKAQDAISQLGQFLDELKSPEFERRFEDEHEFTMSLRNRDFWRKFLVHVG